MRIISKCFHGLLFILIMGLFFVSFPVAFLLYGNKKYWLISEVDFDARDNGIHFFKYLRTNHPEINSIYLIDKSNVNYESVSKIGPTLKPHSYKHMLVFISAKAKISTLVHGCSPSSYVTLYLLKHHCTGKNIALKHGIFKNLHPNYFKKNGHLDLICCGAKNEFDFIDKEFGYQSGVAKYTGLARFDALHNVESSNEIFIMPTWRRWLDPVKCDDEFVKSLFFRSWKSLLSNEYLAHLINKKGYKICFYVHPKLNRFVHLFKNLNPSIQFLYSKNGDDVQSHLKSGCIMITDFSSVFFDFAYMRKPAIYFQFDEDDYYKSHYEKAYFDYRDNGFGPVATSCEEAIKELRLLIENNNSINTKFLKRCESFFPLFDSNNCERIYKSIYDLL